MTAAPGSPRPRKTCGSSFKPGKKAGHGDRRSRGGAVPRTAGDRPRSGRGGRDASRDSRQGADGNRGGAVTVTTVRAVQPETIKEAL